MATTPLPQEILRAWQRIEFFQPYSVDKKESSLFLSLNQLINLGDTCLPWHSEELRAQYDIPKKAHYILHVGLFEKSIASEVSRRILGSSDENAEECEQRLNQEGTTCFAKVQLNTEGAPEIDKLSVSSLPWALGHLEKRQFQQLESTCFKADSQRLADALGNFKTTLKPVREEGPDVLRADDILTLLNTYLVPWADFTPEWQYALQIDWYDSKHSASGAENSSSEAEDESGSSTNDLALPILNSFFFEDLEDAITALKTHSCSTLNTYLSQRTVRNADLYSQDGLRAIIDKLHPSKMPLGRWPSEPEHAMSLMQQFAINTAIEDLEDGGLLSVNGPPGTGKTTLLRDCGALDNEPVPGWFAENKYRSHSQLYSFCGREISAMRKVDEWGSTELSFFTYQPGKYVGTAVVVKHHASGLLFITGDTKHERTSLTCRRPVCRYGIYHYPNRSHR